MSHPESNNIMLIGCVCCLSSVILFGLDGQKIPETSFTSLCHVSLSVIKNNLNSLA